MKGRDCQTFAVLSLLSFLAEFGANKDLQITGVVTKIVGPMKSGKNLVARWFLMLYGNKFDPYEVKQALKYLAGRQARREKYERKGPRKKAFQKPKKQLSFDFGG